MGVILTEDCIQRADGTYVCWDRDDNVCYALKKQTLSANDVTPIEWEELMKKLVKPSK
jgi:hypothetical protein